MDRTRITIPVRIEIDGRPGSFATVVFLGLNRSRQARQSQGEGAQKGQSYKFDLSHSRKANSIVIIILSHVAGQELIGIARFAGKAGPVFFDGIVETRVIMPTENPPVDFAKETGSLTRDWGHSNALHLSPPFRRFCN
jgi:hypothetical protein